MKKIVTLCLGAMLFAMCLLVVSTAPNAEGQDFAPNTRLNDDSTTYLQTSPDMTTDNAGNVYVCWMDTRNKPSDVGDIYLCKITNNGSNVGANVRVNTAVNTDTQANPAIAVDENSGTIYVVWHDTNTTKGRYIFIANSTDGGQTFGATIEIYDGPVTTNYAKNPEIAVDDNGYVYVVWQDYRDADPNAAIYFSMSTDGGFTFTPNINVSDNLTNGRYSPSIAVDSSGKIYVVWADGRAGTYGSPAVDDTDIYIATSTDGGASFNPSKRVDTAPAQTRQDSPVLKLDSAGNPCLVWKDERANALYFDIFFAKSTDGGNTFGTEVPVNDTTPAIIKHQSPDMAIDASDNIYVTWTDNRSGGLDYNIFVANSTDGGTTFGTSSLVNDDTSGTFENFPAVATNLGYVFSAWQDFRDGDSNIYYSGSRNIMPPTGLSITDPGVGRHLDLSWNANPEPDIVAYEILRSTVSGSGYAHIGTTTSTTYQDTTAQDYVPYYYVVRAVDGNTPPFRSPYGLEAAGTSTDTLPPTITSGPTVSAVSDTAVTITWTTDEGSDSVIEYGPTKTDTLYFGYPDLVMSHSVNVYNLNPETLYYYRVRSSDASGNAVISNFKAFTTDKADAPPTVLDYDPTGDDVSIDAYVTLEFSEDMDTSAAENATTILGVNATYEWDGRNLTLKPVHLLDYETEYTVLVTSDAKDLKGTRLETFSWTFKTVRRDTVPPKILGVSPGDNENGVDTSTKITVMFSEEMDRPSVEQSFLISPAVEGTFSWDANSLTFIPDEPLDPSTTYNLTIGHGARDTSLNEMEDVYTWEFTTKDGAEDEFTVDIEDTDGDGTPDYLDGDDDNDGFSDTKEREMGTDPLNPDSFPDVYGSPTALLIVIAVLVAVVVVLALNILADRKKKE